MSAIVAIPARLNSKRFPNKILAPIHGRPMLWYVFQGASGASSINDVCILTDSQEIFDQATSWGATVFMTSEDCPSGTARIASIVDKLDADIVVNVQGDEPLISGDLVDTLISALGDCDADVATAVFRVRTTEELIDPNLVKVVRDQQNRAIYFSRATIPYVRDFGIDEWITAVPYWGHVGVYAYRKQVLEDYATFPDGLLEGAEKLEQLRLLEAGKKITTIAIDYRLHDVNTSADLAYVAKILGPAAESD